MIILLSRRSQQNIVLLADIGQQGLWRSYLLRDLAQQSIPEELSSSTFHCLPVIVRETE